MWILMLLAACGSPDLSKLDNCTDGVQSCDCQGACGYENTIWECIDGNWQSVVACDGSSVCIEEEGLPECFSNS